MSGKTEGLARSVHTRLVRHAKTAGLDPNHVLTRYGVERFLYRLSCSPHSERFVLKGALLLLAWLGETLRPTRDADFLGIGDFSHDELLGLCQEVCIQSVPEDGMVYDTDSVAVQDIREGDAHGGRRVTLSGYLGAGRIRLQLDVGIGDAMEPPPEWVYYPRLLDFPAPRLRAYRPETVVAEKLQAMVHLGSANTRLKDFYDVYVLAETHPFRIQHLKAAVGATFERRGTPVPDAIPLALTVEFATEELEAQWVAFLARNGIDAPGFVEIQERLTEFLAPVMAGQSGAGAAAEWPPGGPWGGRL